jgi:UDP-N-acetylmuramate dehydrogenase
MSALKIDENVPLAPLTTFNVGGAARFLARVANEKDVLEVVDFARERGLKLFVLGGGSNVLIADRGFDGVILQISIRGIEFNGEIVTAAAGEDWDEFCGECVNRDLAGVECLSGIPGFVGGTPVQNVGAYGQEVSETILSVRAFDLKTGSIVELSNADCRFSYRASIFNTTERGRFIVLAVTFKLTAGGAPRIAYKDLKLHFGDRFATLGETREAVRRIRAEKGMLVRQGGPDSNSAGSFFKNPIVSIERFSDISTRFPGVPSFPAAPGLLKIPAAWLIENAGFEKGFRVGNAGLSTRHSLALTNRGNSTADEICHLKNLIQDEVSKLFAIDLEVEPVLLGF